MKLNHIKDEVCPSCGARAVAETQRHQHAHGDWFEEREFHCGHRQKFSPNISKLEVIAECTRSDAYKSRIEAEKQFILAVAEFIERYPEIRQSLKKDIVANFSWRLSEQDRVRVMQAYENRRAFVVG